jgi:hypothetical protein
VTTEPPEKAKQGGHIGWVVTGGRVIAPSWPSLPQDYSVEGMSDSLLNFLQHLREFGLVFQRKVCTPSHLASRRVGCWGAAARLGLVLGY